jgi:hypothetical protein
VIRAGLDTARRWVTGGLDPPRAFTTESHDQCVSCSLKTDLMTGRPVRHALLQGCFVTDWVTDGQLAAIGN